MLVFRFGSRSKEYRVISTISPILSLLGVDIVYVEAVSTAV